MSRKTCDFWFHIGRKGVPLTDFIQHYPYNFNVSHVWLLILDVGAFKSEISLPVVQKNFEDACLLMLFDFFVNEFVEESDPVSLPPDAVSEEHANIWGTWHSTLKPSLNDQPYAGKQFSVTPGSLQLCSQWLMSRSSKSLTPAAG